MTVFRSEVYQNEFVTDGANEINAIVTVTAEGVMSSSAAHVGSSGASVELLVVDCSGSMEGVKLREAKRATAAAIDAINDGVRFAVIAGSDRAYALYPPDARLATSSDTTRAAAKDSLRVLRADGGTHIGEWLLAARTLSEQAAGASVHAILLTDGRIEGEAFETFLQALDSCEGVFSCDSRGVGTDWEVSELRRIADKLMGTVDIVAEPEHLAEDFAALMRQSMAKGVANVALRIWAPQGAEVVFVKQVSPRVDDITAKAVVFGPLAKDYPTGSWASEARDYHVCIRVQPGPVGTEKLAGRASLIVDGEIVSQGLIRAVWTDDHALTTKIDPQVAHYTGQAELANAIQQGLEAQKQGDTDVATAKLGRAVQLAKESGNEDTMKLLAKVVDVQDADTGTVRLKRQVELADAMALDTRSTKTVRTKKVGP
jgi:hypothetical protein